MCFPVISVIAISLFPRVINFHFFLSNDRWPCSKTEKKIVKIYLSIHLTMFLKLNHNSQIFK